MMLSEKNMQHIKAYVKDVVMKKDTFYESLRRRDVKAFVAQLKELPPVSLRPAALAEQYSPRVTAAVQKARERVHQHEKGKALIEFVEGNVHKLREKLNGRKRQGEE